MEVRPLQDRLVVKLDKLPEKVGSLYLAGSAEKRERTGTVISTGPGRYSKKGVLIPTEVKEGQRIAFFRENFEHKPGKALMGALAQIDENIGLLQERDILWVIEED